MKNLAKMTVMALITMGSLMAQADINIELPGTSNASVDGSACLITGGTIDDSGKYSICVGGRYDGLISAIDGEERSCDVVFQNAKSLEKVDGSSKRFPEALAAAAIAISKCSREAKEYSPELYELSKDLKKACADGADQASGLFLRQCFANAAQFLHTILPK